MDCLPQWLICWSLFWFWYFLGSSWLLVFWCFVESARTASCLISPSIMVNVCHPINAALRFPPRLVPRPNPFWYTMRNAVWWRNRQLRPTMQFLKSALRSQKRRMKLGSGSLDEWLLWGSATLVEWVWNLVPMSSHRTSPVTPNVSIRWTSNAWVGSRRSKIWTDGLDALSDQAHMFVNICQYLLFLIRLDQYTPTDWPPLLHLFSLSTTFQKAMTIYRHIPKFFSLTWCFCVFLSRFRSRLEHTQPRPTIQPLCWIGRVRTIGFDRRASRLKAHASWIVYSKGSFIDFFRFISLAFDFLDHLWSLQSCHVTRFEGCYARSSFFYFLFSCFLLATFCCCDFLACLSLIYYYLTIPYNSQFAFRVSGGWIMYVPSLTLLG